MRRERAFYLSFPALLVCYFVFAPSSCADDEQALQEQWLRYTNFESRQNRHLKAEPAKQSSNGSSDSGKPGGLILPERPGSQTTEGWQFTVPNWNFQQDSEKERRNEVFLGENCFAPPAGLLPQPYMRAPFLSQNSAYFYRSGRPAAFAGRVLQFGPSPSSGNYYKSGSPWQLPVQVQPNSPRDYWGPQGSPFQLPGQ